MSARNASAKQVFAPGTAPNACGMNCANSVSMLDVSYSLKAARTTPTSLTLLSNASSLAVLFAGSMLTSVFTLNGLVIGLIASAATLAILGAVKMHATYQAFANLGPGNITSPAITEFIRMAGIARSNTVRTASDGALGYLHPLPLRQGPTPYVTGHAPQVQLNQNSPEDVQSYFVDRLALFAFTQSDASSATATSCDCTSGRNVRGFICSACQTGSSSGAVHVVLHPFDFEQVIQMGWGERHPLAGTGFRGLLDAPCLPATLALVYAPREYSEVCIVMRFIEVGAKFLSDIEGGRA